MGLDPSGGEPGRPYAPFSWAGPSALEGGAEPASGSPLASVTTRAPHPASGPKEKSQTLRNQSPRPWSRKSCRPPESAVPEPAAASSKSAAAAATAGRRNRLITASGDTQSHDAVKRRKKHQF